MQKKISRRDFLKIGATGAAAAFLASCAQEAAPTQAPAAVTQAPAAATEAAVAVTEPVKASGTVDFLAWGDAVDLPAWDKLKAAYATKNANVTLNLTTVADPNANFYTKLQTSVAGGAPPDVSSFQGWEWQTYADKDLLAPVDDFVTRDGFDEIYPLDIQSVADTTVRGGKKYLVPLQFATMVMFYAKKVFDDAGVAYPTDDWTFDQFLEIAQKLTKTEGENKVYGLQANGAWFRDIHWIRSTGKQEFDSLVDPKKASFNQPEIVDIIQKMVYDVYHELKLAGSQADISAGANVFQNGNVGMKYDGPWWFPQMNSPELRAENKQHEFDVVMMPKGADEARPHRGWAEGVALLKGDNVEAAWDFASFMASEEGDKIYSEITGRMPNRISQLESYWLPLVQEKFQFSNGKAFLEAFKRSEVDVVGGLPRSKMNAEVVKPVGWDPMVGGTAKAADVLPKVDAALQALLDDYWANA